MHTVFECPIVDLTFTKVLDTRLPGVLTHESRRGESFPSGSGGGT